MELLAQIVATLLIYTCLALSLNFVMGKTSVWSVGHLAYFGIGALIAASVGSGGSLSFVLGLLLAAFFGGILGLLVGLSTMRLQQDYFVILSIALSELVLSLSISWKGPAGFDRLARPNLPLVNLQNDWMFIALVLLPVTLMFMGLFKHFSSSPLERVCALIRTNEPLAQVLKISPTRYKVHCFWLGAAVASVCGALSTFFFKSTDPGQISLQNNLMLFGAVIFGGLNSIRGSVLAALLLIAVPTILESVLIRGPFGSFYVSESKQLLFGLLIFLVVRCLPKGVAGSVALSEPRTVE